MRYQEHRAWRFGAGSDLVSNTNTSGLLSTTKVKATGLSTVDGILDGRKWSTSTLTYSFPTLASAYEYSGENSNNFQAFNEAQKAAMRSVLAEYSSVANIKFVEVIETATTHATLRFAESNAAPTAYAYYPVQRPRPATFGSIAQSAGMTIRLPGTTLISPFSTRWDTRSA